MKLDNKKEYATAVLTALHKGVKDQTFRTVQSKSKAYLARALEAEVEVVQQGRRNQRVSLSIQRWLFSPFTIIRARKVSTISRNQVANIHLNLQAPYLVHPAAFAVASSLLDKFQLNNDLRHRLQWEMDRINTHSEKKTSIQEERLLTQ